MNEISSQSRRVGAPQTSGAGETVIDFGRVLSILRRGWWVMGATGLLGAVVAAAIVLQTEPTFYAKSQILIGQTNRSENVLGALIQDLSPNDDSIAGEIAFITSGRILSKVSERLDLQNRAEFNADLRPPEPPPSFAARIADDAVEAFKGFIGIAPPDDESGVSDGASIDPIANAARTGQAQLGEQVDYVSQLETGLSVRKVGTSSLVDVQYVSPDRLLAAAVPNTIVDVYLDDQLDRKFNALRRVTSGLQTRLTGMRERLENSERAVIEYRTSNLAQGFGGGDLLTQQIGDLSRRVSEVSAVYAELASDLTGIDSLIANSGAISAAGLFQSPVLDRLQGEIVDLRQRRELLLQRFGPDSAQTRETIEAIERNETIIAQEAQRLRDELSRRTDQAANRVDALRAELRKLEERAVEQAEREIRLTQLERDYEAEQTVYTTFLDKFTETSETLNLQEGDAQVIAYADPPVTPIAPQKKLSVVLGTIGGVFVGMGLVFVRALTDNSVRSSSQLRSLVGGKVLTQPRAPAFLLGRANPLVSAMRKPLGPLSESIRTLRSHLMLSMPSRGGIIVTFVSNQTNNGKTTTSILLARSLAQMGVSCVLVEADLRRPSMTRLMGLEPKPDLVDALTGKLSPEQALQYDNLSGARILTATPGLADPAGMLLSEDMTNLLQELRSLFRVVIIDTAPVGPVSDAAPMIRLADQVVLMVPYGMHRNQVEQGLETLTKLETPQILSVLSMTPRKMQEKDGYTYQSY